MRARTTISVEPPAREGRAVRIRTTTGLLAARIVRADERSARLALVATHALLLDGDDVEIDVRVAGGVELVLTEIAATVAYRGEGRGAAWRANATVAPQARLHWWGEPFVVATGAAVQRWASFDVAEEGRLLVRDTLVAGRAGERGGIIDSRTRVDVAGRPAVVEDLTLDGQRPVRGIAGDRRVLDQILVAGAEPLPEAVGGARAVRYAHGAAALRWLGHQTHESPFHHPSPSSLPVRGNDHGQALTFTKQGRPHLETSRGYRRVLPFP